MEIWQMDQDLKQDKKFLKRFKKISKYLHKRSEGLTYRTNKGSLYQ